MDSNTYNLKTFLKRSLLPIGSAVAFLIAFLRCYLLLTLYAINPLYFFSLSLAIPFLFFTGFTVYANVKDMWVGQATRITAFFLVVFTIAFYLVYTSFLNEATNQIVTDPAKYPRAVRLSSLYDDRRLEVFPEELPESAYDIEFTYIPLYRYDRETVSVYFKADAETLADLEDGFDEACIWSSSPEMAQSLDIQMRYEHYKNTPYESSQASPLPDDFTIYIFASQHISEEDFGILTYAAVSNERGEVIMNSQFWW